ncbi:hypothetical protein E3N88_30049 [Mikania micrantha]|uniref:Uncharacterized protein n=1 Tax=Mikania micrantha TaxID=192012 RepID=A0A5N6ML66_9ASTR|nr:hypothetical protein E3N88_30049 [Mikania micrantha]
MMEIISKHIIKPSSPTPTHSKTIKFSLLDRLTLHSYTPILLIYESESLTSKDVLKKSLSETLTKYYPFAGRLQEDGKIVDCCDQGVIFVDAKIAGCGVHDFIQNPKYETQKLLFPEGFLWKESCIDSSFLAVQVTSFEGGGMAVTISISHKVADGCTIATFLSDWAAMVRGEVRPTPMILANYISDLLDPNVNVPEIVMNQSKSCVTKRYVFDSKKIEEMKTSVSGVVENPTKVEVVTAHLYKCAITASTAKMNSLRKSIWIQLVNMRPRIKKPLPENSIGNFTWYFIVSNNEKQMSLSDLAVEMKKGIKDLCNGGDNLDLTDWLMDVGEFASNVKELFDDLDVYRCSSMCRRPFYQTDFGWGCPKWVTMADVLVKNTFVLFDRPNGDGIEAMVSLEEDDLSFFQSNQDLLP